MHSLLAFMQEKTLYMIFEKEVNFLFNTIYGDIT